METMKMFQKGYRQMMTAKARNSTFSRSRERSEKLRFLVFMMGPPQNRAVSLSDAFLEMALAAITRMKDTTDLNRPTAVP